VCLQKQAILQGTLHIMIIERGLWIGHGRVERRSDAVGETLGRRGETTVVNLVLLLLGSVLVAAGRRRRA
jgi:hypothetical protein